MREAFAVRELGKVAVVGRKAPVRIFEPMTREEWDLRKSVLKRFSEALNEFYAGRFAEALPEFENIQAEDRASVAYAAKCRQFMEAPPQAWDGVWVVGEK